MKEELPVELDAALPFVIAVATIASEDNSLDAAVDVLRAEEVRWGVSVWAEPSGRSHLGAGVYALREPGPIGLGELAPLLTDYKRFNGRYRPAAEDSDDALIDGHLLPFLNATQLVIQGTDFTNDHFILFADGTISAWTQRTWGELMAEWAEMSGWGAHVDDRGKVVRWQPEDFYAGLDDDVIVGYQEWQQRVRRVIRRKTERELAAPTSGGENVAFANE